jgi:hypothetical protein
MNTALVRGARCYACRHDLLQSFMSISGVSISQPGRHIRSLRFRNLSTGPHLRSQNSSIPTPSAAPDETTQSKEEQLPATEPVPWYLQVDSPTPTTQPVLQRQEIPALPDNSPPILEPLLTHLSLEIGLDDLAILDLRGRDPPPALGGNVIMIIGTARSLKHLNVSADRFCRWLRSAWKLRPYADGLLGRNELKIKLRRRARRARIASNAGGTLESADDGITTGWICVNAGIVEQKENPREEQFEGFGKIAGGTRIVVQMFTEERRADVNLEQLWSAEPKRGKREDGNQTREKAAEGPEEVRHSADISQPSSDRGFGQLRRPSANIALEQRRGFATITRQKDCTDPMPSTINAPTEDPGVTKQGQSSDVLSIFRPLSKLSAEKIKEELGDGPDDRGSTFFLQLFYNNISNASPAEKSEARLKLLCVGTLVQHPLFTKDLLWEAFEEHTACGYPLSDDRALEVVSALLTPRSVGISEGTASLPDHDKELALRLLDFLSLRGTDVLNMKVFNILYKVASSANAADQSDADVSRIEKVMAALDLSFDPEEAYVQMEMRFKNRDFDGFWRLWHAFPFNETPRGRREYELLFRLHAELGESIRARDCVSTWASMMEREEPPVALEGEIVPQLMACIRLSDPSVPGKSSEGMPSSMAVLWNRCLVAWEEDRYMSIS